MADGDRASESVRKDVVERMVLALRNSGFRASATPDAETISVLIYDNKTEAEIEFTMSITSEEVPF